MLVFSAVSKAEVIFKKDGSLVKGTITRDGTRNIVVRTDNGKIVSIPRREIMRILYTKMYMGKVYVRLTNGDVLGVYKVDEDQDTYTFRKELYKPNEFKVKREKVMFIARSNPTDLKAEAEETGINLEWLPPFKPPKKYRVYLAGPGFDFKVIAEPDKPAYEIEDLESNTTYIVKVTAIDHQNVESLPTDQVKVKTGNIPPSTPGSVIKEELDRGGMQITWSSSRDDDGTVKKYIVFGATENERKKLGDTETTGYTIENTAAYIFLEVVAVDDLGGMSDPAIVRTGPLEKRLEFSTGIFIPMGHFADLADTGYGCTVTLSWRDIFMPRLFGGISAGFYYLPGDEYTNKVMKETRCVFFIPIFMHIGYRYALSDKVFLSPYLSAGVVYMNMPYVEKDSTSLNFEEENRQMTSIGPAAEAGITVQYQLGKSIVMGIKAGQGLLVKREILEYPFSRLEISAGITL